ncbi:MAG: glycerol kinase GlpK [Acidobacteria bacterium]|nr:glycerol kinase GlpK [Acidobacteriota bacterium]MBV9478501.1 glycerol kinase GlpK [Acidobacteriota bacterium]
MATVIALDQGTTSSRAIAFDERGTPLVVAQREFRQFYPQPGWVEHDANEIWETQRAVLQEVLARVHDVAAIGITNQRETTVLWDRETGEPVAPAIVWQDRRTAPMCDALRPHAERIRAKTGLVLDAYFSATKLRWLLERTHVDPARLAFGTIDTWLVWKLTGGRVHATDVTNASRTMLFDIHRAAWDDELLDLLGIPASVLPEVRASSAKYGETEDGIPIAGIAGDQQAALFGQRCTRAGMAKNTYGTGSFVVMQTGTRVVDSRHGLLSTIAWQLGDAPLQYALEGSIFVTGAAVQWLRDRLQLIRTAADIEPLAASVPDCGGVVLVPAFTGLGTPHWDPHARGTIVGLTLGTTAAHLARATLESIALQTVDVLDAMRHDSGIALEELRVDGGASTNDLLMQLQADLAGIPVVRTRVAETTALGAAYLAGLAAGVWETSDAIDAQWQPDRVFTPRLSVDAREAKLATWRRAVGRAKEWASSV